MMPLTSLRRTTLAAVATLLAGCGDDIDVEAVARGAEAYEFHCSACHAANDVVFGPPLAGVVGRAAGAVPGYDYSPALAGGDIVWTEDALVTLLLDADAVAPGTTMVISHLEEGVAQDIVSYLTTLR